MSRDGHGGSLVSSGVLNHTNRDWGDTQIHLFPDYRSSVLSPLPEPAFGPGLSAAMRLQEKTIDRESYSREAIDKIHR